MPGPWPRSAAARKSHFVADFSWTLGPALPWVSGQLRLGPRGPRGPCVANFGTLAARRPPMGFLALKEAKLRVAVSCAIVHPGWPFQAFRPGIIILALTRGRLGNGSRG